MRPLAEDGKTTRTESLDGCSMSKGIEQLDGNRSQHCVASARRSEGQGGKWRYPTSESVGQILKVVARLEESDECRPLVS